LVQPKLFFSKISDHVQVVGVLLDLLSQLSLRLLVLSLSVFDFLSALILSLLELVEELLHDC
jgi:hypothetical protein